MDVRKDGVNYAGCSFCCERNLLNNLNNIRSGLGGKPDFGMAAIICSMFFPVRAFFQLHMTQVRTEGLLSAIRAVFPGHRSRLAGTGSEAGLEKSVRFRIDPTPMLWGAARYTTRCRKPAGLPFWGGKLGNEWKNHRQSIDCAGVLLVPKQRFELWTY